jgi:serine/threonine protein kinase
VSQLIEANNTAYMVTDYEGGGTLESVLDEGEQAATLRVGELGQHLTEGLKDLHDANIEHRDVTPRKIILRHDGSTVLIDFGSVRAPWSVDVDADLRKRRMRVYAAPEQMTQRYPPGPKTDFYGLGAVLYRCILGKPPPSADKRMQLADSWDQLREVDIA